VAVSSQSGETERHTQWWADDLDLVLLAQPLQLRRLTAPFLEHRELLDESVETASNQGSLTARRARGYGDSTAAGRSRYRTGEEELTPMMLRSATLLISTLLVSVFAPAFAQPSMKDAEMEKLRTYCRADIERLCPKIQPGGGRIKACLMEHKDEISVGCAKALQGLKKSH
jgi:cysteine rich repeat protein